MTLQAFITLRPSWSDYLHTQWQWQFKFLFHNKVPDYFFLPASVWLIENICSAHISTLLGAQGANPETQGQAPFSFTISVLGSFTCITQHTGPTALRPIRRTKQLWLTVLLKDISTATGQAGIRTHILTTPELESNALERSATTLIWMEGKHDGCTMIKVYCLIRAVCINWLVVWVYNHQWL